MSKAKKNKKKHSNINSESDSNSIYTNSESAAKNNEQLNADNYNYKEDNNTNEKENKWGCLFVIILVVVSVVYLLYFSDNAELDVQTQNRTKLKNTKFDSNLVLDINAKHNNVVVKGSKDFNAIYDFYDIVNYLEVSNLEYKHLNMLETQSLFSAMGMYTTLEYNGTAVRGSIYIQKDNNDYIGLELYRDRFTRTTRDSLHIKVYKAYPAQNPVYEVLFTYALVENKAIAPVDVFPTFTFNRNEFRLYTYDENKHLVGYTCVF